MSEPQVVLVSISEGIDKLIEQCARGELPFSGPNSLHSRIHAMGYKTTSLYEMVMIKKGRLMAAAQFRNEAKKIDISRRLGAPKVATLDAWFKQIRKTIPEVPDPKKTDWFISHQEADYRWIKYELHNSIGERCYVIVDRSQEFLGR